MVGHAADVAREPHRQIEQRFIAAVPSDEGEADRAAGDRTHRQGDLRQSAQSGKTGQPHDADAKRFQRFGAGIDARGNARRRRQRKNGAGLDQCANVLARPLLFLPGRVGVALRYCPREPRMPGPSFGRWRSTNGP